MQVIRRIKLPSLRVCWHRTILVIQRMAFGLPIALHQTTPARAVKRCSASFPSWLVPLRSSGKLTALQVTARAPSRGGF
ncbi:hypothetical protein G4Y79_04495 [Phototrophicus methaneseepsis]|uniref:Uncharacterized protein n=1 Tax=Phototrophicus methaneseepsis TaxID=2710758 RepID=A0A7S8EB07_9CHLR|nr:hypothetical protein [Phototrophicus methaneseepsis]QPC83646.1 hypothetical protein G4Y79_04495 [Phototrophicus methaneseepsis]